MKTRTVALAGNPNTGKTSLFNALTGMRCTVGNWPGVTVERKEGFASCGDRVFRVVDLPGIYSLGGTSIDERIAAEYLLGGHPDLTVAVLDASTFERSLYLVVQFLEMGLPLALALNMQDIAARKGIRIDEEQIETLLGVRVISTVAREGIGIDELKCQVAELVSATDVKPALSLPYGADVSPYLDRIGALLEESGAKLLDAPTKLSSIKLAERDAVFLEALRPLPCAEAIAALLEEADATLGDSLGYSLQNAVMERRWAFVEQLAALVCIQQTVPGETLSLTARADRAATHRYFGLPLFLFSMWAVFRLTYALGDPLAGMLETALGELGTMADGKLAAFAVSPLLRSFLIDGVLGGVGSVIVFVPHIMLLFAFLAVLEDSGYMARGAFVMDRLMHLFGLHGKSFIPMLMGFGCNVPAMMATRILERPRDRIITLLVIPFMSCSARLPVFVLFSGAFFDSHAASVLFSMYALGIIVAILTARLLGGTLFSGERSQLVMELPPYRAPSPRIVLHHAFDRGMVFLRKAGTFILAAAASVWVLGNLPVGVEYASADSLVGRLGALVAPLLAPAGFGFWQAGAALVFGFFAKEVVVGSLGVLYGTGLEGLPAVLTGLFTPLSAYAFLVFTLLYVPCAATIAAFWRETESVAWTVFMVVYTTFVAWLGATLVFQGGILLGLA